VARAALVEKELRELEIPQVIRGAEQFDQRQLDLFVRRAVGPNTERTRFAFFTATSRSVRDPVA
jgi:hypothetical protein